MSTPDFLDDVGRGRLEMLAYTPELATRTMGSEAVLHNSCTVIDLAFVLLFEAGREKNLEAEVHDSLRPLHLEVLDVRQKLCMRKQGQENLIVCHNGEGVLGVL